MRIVQQLKIKCNCGRIFGLDGLRGYQQDYRKRFGMTTFVFECNFCEMKLHIPVIDPIRVMGKNSNGISEDRFKKVKS